MGNALLEKKERSPTAQLENSSTPKRAGEKASIVTDGETVLFEEGREKGKGLGGSIVGRRGGEGAYSFQTRPGTSSALSRNRRSPATSGLWQEGRKEEPEPGPRDFWGLL